MNTSQINKAGLLLILLAVLLFSIPFIFMTNLMPASMTASAPVSEIPFGSEVIISYKWTTPDRTDVYHNRQWAVHMSGREGANNKYGSVQKIWEDPWAYRTPNEIVEGSFLVEVCRQTDTNVWKMRDGSWSTKDAYYHVYVNQLFDDGDTAILFFDDVDVIIKLFVGDPVKADYNLIVYILDENSKALSGVTVSLNNGQSAVTGSNGIASFSVNGQFEIIGIKSGYENVEKSVSITNSDVEVALSMNKIIVPTPEPTPTGDGTPTPTEEPGETPTDTSIPVDWPLSSSTLLPSDMPLIPGKATINFFFSDCESNKVDDVELSVNDDKYMSQNGIISFAVPIGTHLQVVALKEGYNRFSASYVADRDLIIKVNLADSGGNYFVDIGDLKDTNPITDAFGTFGVVPEELAIIAGILLIFGLILMRKK